MEGKKISQLYIGLMSGTSIDGIDAAILDFSGTPKTIATLAHPIPGKLKDMLHMLCVPGASGVNEIELMGEADAWLGEVLGEAVNTLLEKAVIDKREIIAVGCHG